MSKTSHDGECALDELSAWEQWKKICSILGCPQPAQDLLVKKVGKQFSSLVSKLSGGWVKLKSSDFKDLANEFDVGVIERDKSAGLNEKVKVKHYKDWVWQRIVEGDNKPLDCICRLLFGRNGPLHRTVKRWIRQNYSVRVENGRFRFHDSVDRPLSSGDEGSGMCLGDTLDSKRYGLSVSSSDIYDAQCVSEWMSEMNFTYSEAVVLLACQVGLSVDSDEMKEALQIKKSAIAERQSKAIKRMREAFSKTPRGQEISQIAQHTPSEFRGDLCARLLEIVKPNPNAQDFVAVVQDLMEPKKSES